MTLREAIASVDTLKPNQYTTAQKVSWLSQCDNAIHSNIVMTHALPAGASDVFVPYSETEMDRELIAPPPYDILYRHYLESRIDLYNKENINYNNTNLLYTTAYNAFAGWYTQHHMPKGMATHFKL